MKKLDTKLAIAFIVMVFIFAIFLCGCGKEPVSDYIAQEQIIDMEGLR